MRLLPFHCTTEPEIKLAPFTVRVKPGLPAAALLGDNTLNDGTGLPADWLINTETPEQVAASYATPVTGHAEAGQTMDRPAPGDGSR